MALFSVLGFLPFFTAATLIWLVGMAIYRIYFHPLAKYPGPLLWKLTQWPEARSAWSGRRHLDLHMLHEKYGDVVRFSPDKLSFRTAQALQDIYTDRRANVIKAGWTATGLRINPGVTTHSLSDRQLHAARRRLLNNAFSDSALKTLEQYILSSIREWCGHLGESASDSAVVAHGKSAAPGEKGWTKGRDMGHWSTLLTVDVLGELCFGASFGAMKTGYSYIMELLISSSRFQQSVCCLPIRELLYPLMTPRKLLFFGKLTGLKNIEQKAKYRQDVGVLVQKRFEVEKDDADRAEDDRRRDFFHYLLHAKDPETGETFMPKDLVGEAALLVGAGADTSSTALSALFFYLLRHPAALDRLAKEVRTTFTEVEEIRHDARLTGADGLPYLRACVDEAMRLAPPVPGLLDRAVLPGGVTVDGTAVPEGTVVGVPIYAIHHHERYFPRPFDFVPERWIAGEHSSKVAGFPVTCTSVEVSRAAFHAFSSGPRGCVGKNMAYMELLVAAARVVFLFDMRLAPGDTTGAGSAGDEPGRRHTGEYQLKDWLISSRDGPIVQFKRRGSVAH